MLSASVADEVAEATASPQLQDALDQLSMHQHPDNPYQRLDRRPDNYERRDRGRQDLRSHDERRHGDRRHDERRIDERRHELRGYDERRLEKPYNVIHDERRYDELRHDVLSQQQPWWTDKDYIKHIDDEHDIPGPVILRNIKSNDNVSSLY